MADKSSQLILTALSKAASGAAPMHGGKAAPGLFPATAAGKQAATRAREAGYLQCLPHNTERNGKVGSEPWGLTEKGFSYLLDQATPREVLQDFIRAVEGHEGQLADLHGLARQARDHLAALRFGAEQVLRQVVPPANEGGLNGLFESFVKRTQALAPGMKKPADCTPVILRHLQRWHKSGAAEDCPLPDLFRQTELECPGLTIGQLHDALRKLHHGEQIYLHPWTGPLYEIPEPPYALLVGHEVAYYASVRSGQ